MPPRTSVDGGVETRDHERDPVRRDDLAKPFIEIGEIANARPTFAPSINPSGRATPEHRPSRA
jgi:hypothetical protein